MPIKMERDGKNNKRVPWTLVGMGIGVSISVLSWIGISELLSVIKKSKLPEEELIIFTSLFYGIVFFIALGGVRAESRRYRLLISKTPYGELPPPPSKAKATLNRIKTILWHIFCMVSLGWLTPVLIIYWAGLTHSKWAVATCACFSSLLAGAYYVLKKTDEMKMASNHLFFSIGVIIGAALVTILIIGY